MDRTGRLLVPVGLSSPPARRTGVTVTRAQVERIHAQGTGQDVLILSPTQGQVTLRHTYDRALSRGDICPS